LSGGEVDPVLLEDVLGDLAARGAIGAVWTPGGDEVRAPAVNALMAPREEPKMRSERPAPVKPASKPPSKPPVAELSLAAAPEPEAFDPTAPPSSLADAVMKEISDRVSEPRVRSDPPPIVEPSALRPRSNPPSGPQITATPIPPDAVVPAAESDKDASKTEIDAPVGRALPGDADEA